MFPYWDLVSNYVSKHCSDVIRSTIVSQITGVSIVCSTACSGTDQRIRQSSESLAFVRGINRSIWRRLHGRSRFGHVLQKWDPFFRNRWIASIPDIHDYIIFFKYYTLSIYIAVIYDAIMIKLRSCLHSWTTTHTSPLQASNGVSFVSYTKENDRDISRTHGKNTRRDWFCVNNPDSKVHGASMGPTWAPSAPDGPRVGPMNLAIRDMIEM